MAEYTQGALSDAVQSELSALSARIDGAYLRLRALQNSSLTFGVKSSTEENNARAEYDALCQQHDELTKTFLALRGR